MEKFSLDNIYVVGNELLDAQHKVILNYMAKIYSYLISDKKRNDLFELLERLDISCKLHFMDEEELMEEMDFHDIDDHKAQHALFATHLGGFIGRSEELDRVKSIDNLLFLKSWFLEHIEVFDKQYVEYKKRMEKTVHESIKQSALDHHTRKV